eukprot:TRINITY_DN4857_c0_g1_i7.p1 TRINITY_DN4857_c0_g1~~TRINITY_DN4857_c0_g1_i7.p1  ORF type:complete len:419 (-),score=52.76 TRINITY_DN4857_c0_g1_i7:93-1310(-)
MCIRDRYMGSRGSQALRLLREISPIIWTNSCTMKVSRMHLFYVRCRFRNFFSDDEIKHGAIRNLASFLKVFDEERREHYVELFVQLQKDQKKWRIRELIAKQIKTLSEIFSKETTFRMIVPISIKLCNDVVSSVRDEASKQIYALVLRLYDSEDIYRDNLIETIRLFSNSPKYTQRQAFIYMCKNLMNYREIFEKHFLDCFYNLRDDKIPNVRIAVAKVLNAHYLRRGPFVEHPQIFEMVRFLQGDKCKEIKELLSVCNLGPSNEKSSQRESKLNGVSENHGHEHQANVDIQHFKEEQLDTEIEKVVIPAESENDPQPGEMNKPLQAACNGENGDKLAENVEVQANQELSIFTLHYYFLLLPHLCFFELFIPCFFNFYHSMLVFCLLYTSPSPRDGLLSRMPSSA